MENSQYGATQSYRLCHPLKRAPTEAAPSLGRANSPDLKFSTSRQIVSQEEGRSHLPDLGGPGHVTRGNCRSGPLLGPQMKKPEDGGARGFFVPGTT